MLLPVSIQTSFNLCQSIQQQGNNSFLCEQPEAEEYKQDEDELHTFLRSLRRSFVF